MNRLIYKRIIGLFIFALTVMLFGITNVYADSTTCSEVIEEFSKNDFQKIRYGMSMEYDGEDDNDHYRIKIKMSDDELKNLKEDDPNFTKSKIKFKVTGMYLYAPGNGQTKDLKDENGKITFDNTDDVSDNIKYFSSDTIKDGGTISISRENVGTSSDPDRIGLAVKLEPVDFNDPKLVKECGKKASFYAVVFAFADISNDPQDNQEEESQTIDDSGKWTNVGPLDCNNPKNTFERNFCKDKAAAAKSSTTKNFTIRNYVKGNVIKYENNTTELKPNNPLAFKCDYEKYVLKTDANGNVSDDDYYINKQYLYGKGTMVVDEITYQYNGEYSKSGLKLTASCKLTCEEVVKVEYGPPVASKAGLCFEYKVKVTSRVNCEMIEKPTPPPTQVVCTPKPYCYHPGGYIAPQGGPSEDFDSCVSECDGGVYSDRCVNKCYKQVYGTSAVRQTSGEEIAYADKLAADGSKVNEYKIVKIDNKNVIVWENDRRGKPRLNSKGKTITAQGKTSSPADSYWHKTRNWGYKYSVYSKYSSTGIPQRGDCTGKCSWKKKNTAACKDPKNARYLNAPGVYADPKQSDYRVDQAKNKDLYDKLVKRCEAYASCNTTTAEFTISVRYTEKGDTEKTTTINFPYTENNDKNSKDSITHNENDSISCPTSSNSIILKSRGCYNCGGAGANISENEGEDGLKKMYMTEWSFPGTWIHNKTGKISYKPVNEVTWRKIKEKFCLPLNAGNVNAKWYNYYQNTTKGNDTSYTYYDQDYIKNVQCPDGTTVQTKCGTGNTVPTENDIDYNIKATARKFGLFEWDIDVDCFYAVNDIFPKEKETDKCSLTCSNEQYRVRSVDLSNLFPATSGDSETRTPGFNWSTYANQTEKDKDYISTPANYAKWIQYTAKNGGVYTDEYLDYEVTLTKEIISEIKKSANKEYTKWEGETINIDDESSANSYRSPLFKDGGILSGNSVYPSGNALKCNNIGTHTATRLYDAECAEFKDYDKEGK